MKQRPNLIIIIFACLISSPLMAAGSLFSAVDFRLGFDAEPDTSFNSYEVSATFKKNWSWNLRENVILNLNMTTSVGLLDGGEDTAVYGHIGPLAEIHFADFPISLTISSGLSLYSEDELSGFDIGSHVQFTSGLGLKYKIDDHWSVGYRIQHTSNGGVSNRNPGFNIHVLSIGYTF